MASFERQPNGTWKYRLSYYKGGKRYYKSRNGFRTKKEAQISAVELEQQLNKGYSLDIGEETFASYFQKWFTTYREGKFSWQNEKDLKYCIKIVKNFFGDIKLKDISRTMYQQYLNEFGAGRADATVKKIHIYTKACLKDALNDGVIFKDPTYKAIVKGTIERKKEDIKFLNEIEATKLIIKMKEQLDPKYASHYVILFALVSGCRLSEILGLTWDCINFNNKTATINKTWDYMKIHGFDTTKNESSKRTINIDEETIFILKKLKQSQKERQLKTGLRNQHNLVFVGNNFKPNSHNAINKTLKRACIKLEIKTVTMHALRHTHASILLYHNLNIKYVSRRLGHSDITTTLKTYGHILDELEQRESQLINKIMKTLHTI